MGYSTEFTGQFEIVDSVTEQPAYLNRWLFEQLLDFSQMRHQDSNGQLACYAPNYYCDWEPVSADGHDTIQWTGAEKTYNSAKWLNYINRTFLNPNGFKLSGHVLYQGEEPTDRGKLMVVDNQVVRIAFKHV